MSAKPDRKVEAFFDGRDGAGVRETVAFLRDEFDHAISIRRAYELAVEEFDADVLDGRTVVITRGVFYDLLATLDVEVEGLE